MCAEEARLSADMVRAGFKANDKGAGFAWRAPALDKKGKPIKLPDGKLSKLIVHWKKAMTDLEEVVHLAETLPMPYILHCRIPSIGGPTLDLTHPFPVTRGVELDHEGQIDGAVLFHNGTWHKWQDDMIKGALNAKIKLPRGPFSDSRMLAWMTHLLGAGFLDVVKERVILFSVDDIEIFGTESGWTCVNNVWCSNGGFRHLMNDGKRQPQQIVDHRAGTQLTDGHGGDRRPVAGFCRGPVLMGGSGPNDPPETQGVEIGDEGGEEGSGNSASQGPESARQGAICALRHSLVSDTEFALEYRKLHGHPPPFISRGDTDTTVNPEGWNPKRFRSSLRPGDSDLDQRRVDASRGISHVL